MKPAKIGFGTYRIYDNNDEHYKSLYKALTGGVTLIDTSSNYNNGQSELVTGNVISDLINEKKIRRSDITLITKGGYIQGDMYKEAVRKKNSGEPYSEVIEYASGLWHCIHPDFLRQQIDIQMNRLFQNVKEKYIDVYLLHNPEYFLGWSYNSNQIISDTDIKTEFYRRIRNAFEFLEGKVKSGTIRYYGISSNTFPLSSKKSDFISLERIIEIADKVSSDNHFRFIEFPFNLIESEAYFEKNQLSDSKTLLEYAAKKKIHTLINRPLNCITNKGILRLADYITTGYRPEELKKKLIYTTNLEDEFRDRILPASGMDSGELKKIQKMLILALRINENWNKFSSIEYFNELAEHYFAPRISYLKDFFSSADIPKKTVQSFESYIKCIQILLDEVANYYKILSNERNNFINETLNIYYDVELRKLSLSQKALLLLRSVEGVDCIFVGARKEKYVDELIRLQNEFRTERIGNYPKILKRVKEQLISKNISRAEL
jgi:aryl-alcohol dehydrogenase-like predicted oxidoreductase